MAETTAKSKEDVSPNALARHWCRMYRAVSKVNFPGTDLNISFTLVSAAVLWTVRLMLQYTLIHYFGWPADRQETEEAIGSMAAMFHSMNLLPGLFVALTTQPYRPSGHISDAPQWWQDLVNSMLQFCTGYMVYDSFASIIILHGPKLSGTDWMFLGHHCATIIYMTQCRVIGAGHTSAMICMLLGECTNPFHNGYLASGLALRLECCNGLWMQQFNYGVGFFFSFFYVAIRVLVAPVFFLQVTFDLLFSETRKNIGLANRLFWIFMIWAVEVGSKDWIISCAELFVTYYLHIKGVMHMNAASNSEL